MRRSSIVALLVLAGGWAATLWLAPFSDERVNDLFVYRMFAAPLWDGWLPYLDVFLEYPPLAAPAIALPGLVGGGEEAFRWAFAGWTLVLAVAMVLLCGALAAHTGGDRRRALLAAALMPLLLGAVVRTRFDLAPLVLLLAALALLLAARPRTGMAVLGLAAMTKGFPIVAAPVALAWLAVRTDRRTVLHSAAALLTALALPALVALALSPAGSLDAIEYHLERPVQLESLPASGLLLLDALGAGEVETVNSHRSDGLEHPAAGALTTLGVVAMLGVLAALTMLAGGAATWGHGAASREPSAPDAAFPARAARTLVLASLATVLAFAALGKVLSPQYMIWLVPLATLAFAWRLHALAAVLAVAAVLTQLEFPVRYFDLVAREPFPIGLVAARNLLLLVALALALRALLVERDKQLLDRDRPPVGVALDDHGVEPRVLV